MGAVTVAVLIRFSPGCRDSPYGATLKFDVGSMDASVDDINVNARATLGIVFVSLKGAKIESGTMADARKTLHYTGLSDRFYC